MRNVLICLLSCAMSASLFAQEAPANAAPAKPAKKEIPQEPIFPGSKWLTNDRARPAQPAVTPGETPNLPPSDADIIFNGSTLDALEMADGKPINWTVENGELVTGKGSARTKKKYGSAQLHIEWFTDKNVQGSDQKKGNGGVFMMGQFECQIHSSFNNPTYADGVVGSVYGQTPAMVNVSKAPGNWQTMDIVFNAPTFGEDGKVSEPAHVTILVNGVVTQNNTRILGPTKNKSSTSYEGFTLKEGQIVFQDHKNTPPLRYRNIWVRPIGESDPAKN